MKQKDKENRVAISELVKSRYNLIIHYACSDFNVTPMRISAISVYDMHLGKSDDFSLHKSINEFKRQNEDIDFSLDEIEKHMLTKFYEFVNKKNGYTWVHWNMKSSQFGFTALEERYRMFNESPIFIEDIKKIDLANLFKKIYGNDYVEHDRFMNLAKLNNNVTKELLSGKEEVIEFSNRNYLAVTNSVQKKVRIMNAFIQKTNEGTLKIDKNHFVNWRDIRTLVIKILSQIVMIHVNK